MGSICSSELELASPWPPSALRHCPAPPCHHGRRRHPSRRLFARLDSPTRSPGRGVHRRAGAVVGEARRRRAVAAQYQAAPPLCSESLTRGVHCHAGPACQRLECIRIAPLILDFILFCKFYFWSLGDPKFVVQILLRSW